MTTYLTTAPECTGHLQIIYCPYEHFEITDNPKVMAEDILKGLCTYAMDASVDTCVELVEMLVWQSKYNPQLTAKETDNISAAMHYIKAVVFDLPPRGVNYASFKEDYDGIYHHYTPGDEVAGSSKEVADSIEKGEGVNFYCSWYKFESLIEELESRISWKTKEYTSGKDLESSYRTRLQLHAMMSAVKALKIKNMATERRINYHLRKYNLGPGQHND